MILVNECVNKAVPDLDPDLTLTLTGWYSGIRESLQCHLCVVGVRLPAGPHLPDTGLLLGRHQSQLPREQLRLEQRSWGNRPLSQNSFFCLFFPSFSGLSCLGTSAHLERRRRMLPRCKISCTWSTAAEILT